MSSLLDNGQDIIHIPKPGVDCEWHNKVMILAYQYAETNGRKGFSKITKQAGWWWLKDFL